MARFNFVSKCNWIDYADRTCVSSSIDDITSRGTIGASEYRLINDRRVINSPNISRDTVMNAFVIVGAGSWLADDPVNE